MLHLWVLLVVFLHHLQIHRVMYLETFGFNFLLPVLVVDLDVVENGVYEDADVWVFVR